MCLGVPLKTARYRTWFYAPSACLSVGVGWFIFSIWASVFGYACVCVCLCTFNGTLSNILSLSNGNSVLPQKVRKAVRLSGKAVVSLSWWQCGLTLTQVLKGLWKPERSEMNPICQLEIKHFNSEKWSYELFTQQQPDDIITLHNDRGALTGLWYSLQHTVCVYTHQVHK